MQTAHSLDHVVNPSTWWWPDCSVELVPTTTRQCRMMVTSMRRRDLRDVRDVVTSVRRRDLREMS